MITSWMNKFSERHFYSDGSSPDGKLATSEDDSHDENLMSANGEGSGFLACKM